MVERKTCLVLTEDHPATNEARRRCDAVVDMASRAFDGTGFTVRAGRQFNDTNSFSAALLGADAMVIDSAIDSEDLFSNLQRYKTARDVPIIYLVDREAKTALRDVLAVSYDMTDPASLADAVAQIKSYVSHIQRPPPEEPEPVEFDPRAKECLVLAPGLPVADRQRFEHSLHDALSPFNYGIIGETGIRDLKGLVSRFQSSDAVVFHLPREMLVFFQAIEEGESQGRPVVVVAEAQDDDAAAPNRLKNLLLYPQGSPAWEDNNANDIALAIASKTQEVRQWISPAAEHCAQCGQELDDVLYHATIGGWSPPEKGSLCEDCAMAGIGPGFKYLRYERVPDGRFVLAADMA